MDKMKKLLIVLLVLTTATLAQSEILPLQATWTHNTETDMDHYDLYRTDVSPRVKINPAPIPWKNGAIFIESYDFDLTIPNGSQGTLTFIMKAVDTASNPSLDSNTASYGFDYQAPGAVPGFGVKKRP